VAAKSRAGEPASPRPDRVAAGQAGGFIVLLLATELVLSLPDESASAPLVAQFYAAHRVFIIVLQVVGFVAAGLLGAYAWRLRTVDRIVAGAGVLVAVCALAPGLITLVLAVLADPANPGPAGRWNALEPRGDDLLFVGIVAFAAAVAVRLGRELPLLGVVAALVALAGLTRLILEGMGKGLGVLESVAPLAFVVLVGVMAVLSFRGIFEQRPRRMASSPAGRPRDT
jgi:uncharacterized membrane protein